MMGTHGVFLRLAGRRCVIIGSDEVAAAKALACRNAGAAVVVVGPEAGLIGDAVPGTEIRRRPYTEGDLAGAFLAYATIREPDMVARLRAEALREGVLLNVVDVPDACDFFAGAVIDRDPLTILVGSGGLAPGALPLVRRTIEAAMGPEYGTFVAILGALRRHLNGRPERSEALRAAASPALLAAIRAGDVHAVDRLLAQAAGGSCSLARLGMRLEPEGAWA